MGIINYLKKGIEHYNKGEYSPAVNCFITDISQFYCNSARSWLAYCYEQGLGVEKNLVIAKDLYQVCYDNMGSHESKREFGTWVANRLDVLKDIPLCDSKSTYISEIGNVKVIKNRNAPHTPQFRYNNDEVVVIINKLTSLFEGFHYAQVNIPQINNQWTCDGTIRYFDHYTLTTDFFHLEIMRGHTSRYITNVEGDRLTLFFPEHVNLEYIYVQKTIHNKVKEMLYKRAQAVIPLILQDVSKRIKVPYGKCLIEKACNRNYSAFNYDQGNVITFCAITIQLPVKSLEALCVHELTHNFVPSHGQAFYDKMIELGGEEYYLLDQNLWKEDKWQYFNFE